MSCSAKHGKPIRLTQAQLGDVHAVQIALLKQAAAICRAENLTWYLVGGGALGAVKYQGFVPWDDDLDIALPREDYEKFLRCAPNYLDRQTFLQHYTTDPEYPFVFAKLRAENTTYVEWAWRDTPMHHGIYLDVFPLDGYPRTRMRQWLFQLRFFWIRLLLKSVRRRSFDGRSVRRALENALYLLIGRHLTLSSVLEREDRALAELSIAQSDYLCNYGNKMGRRERVKKDIYGSGCVGSFEGVPVVLPEKTAQFLSQRFGDYLREPESSEHIGSHLFYAVDANHPWRESDRGACSSTDNGGAGYISC